MSNAVQTQPAAAKAPAAAKTPKPKGEFARFLVIINDFLGGSRTVFALAIGMLVLESLTGIVAGLPLKWLIDYLFAQNQPVEPLVLLGLTNVFTTQFGVLVFLSIAILVIAVINSAADSMAEIYLARGGRLLGFQLRDRLYSHLQKLSLAFFGKQRTGDLLSRVTGDVTALEEFAVKSLKDIAGSVFTIVLTFGFLFQGAWQMGLIALITVPILSLASNYFADRIKTAAKKQRATEGELAASAQEMLTSIRVIQTYGSSGNRMQYFAQQSKKAMDIAVQVGRLQAWFGGVLSVLQAVVVVIIVWVGVLLSNNALISIGTLAFFIKLIQDLFKPTKRIIKQWNEVGKIMASSERISEVLDRRPAVEDAPGAIQAPPLKGQIEFRGVGFAYQIDPEDAAKSEDKQPFRLALRSVSFSISPSEVVALVGGSGAGKSTIVQLLPRLYDPSVGQVLIDGHDIKSFTLDSLRSRMSMVLQEAILFNGTVADNIAYGRPDATREEIIAAAIQASAHEFIQNLPEGYDTVLSERAANLSGGQRQRIAIARAFIRNTSILILDEPTTGLDAESTELVQLALRKLMKGKSTIIISHDLNLVRSADKIVVMKNGEISQVGTHKSLLRQGGVYSNLYSKQFGDEAVEKEAQPTMMSPAVTPRPVRVDAFIDDDDDDDEILDDDLVPAVPHGVFQTLIGQAIPRPVPTATFQTMMMRAVVRPATGDTIQPALPAAATGDTLQPALPAAATGPTMATPKLTPAATGATLLTGKPIDTSADPPTVPIVRDPPVDMATSQTIAVPTLVPPVESTTATERVDIRSTVRLPEVVTTAPPAPAGAKSVSSAQRDLLQSQVVQQELPGLRLAFDPQSMREHLQAALFGKSSSYRIERCTPDKALYLPGEGCSLRYQLEVRGRNGEVLTPLISARVFGGQLASAIYLRDRLAPLAALMRGREELAPFSTPIALLEPLNMVVSVFPIDGELPSLTSATDNARMVEVFNETLHEAVEGTLVVQNCQIEPVHYARRQRCVLRYSLYGRQPANDSPRELVVYGKINAGSGGTPMRSSVAALREQLQRHASGFQFRVPQLLGFRPDMQLALLEALPGSAQIDRLLKLRLKGLDDPEDETLMLEEALAAAANVAGTLHSSGIMLGRRRTLDGELATLRSEIEQLRRAAPELGAQLQGWLEQIEAYAEESDPLRPCFSHGNFKDSKLIFDGSDCGLIDYDTICQAEPALDLGHFQAYLRLTAQNTPRFMSSSTPPATLVDQLCGDFLRIYIAATGDKVEDAERLRVRVSVYEAVSLLRLVIHSWQVIKLSRLEHTITLLEQRLAALPQLGY